MRLVSVISVIAVALTTVFLVQGMPDLSYAAEDSNGNEEMAQSLSVSVGYAGDPPELLKEYTADELTALGTTDQMYTWISGVRRPIYHAVRGVKLRDIIKDAGVDINSVARIHFTCSDAHETEELTIGFLFNTKRYYYPNLVKSWDFDENVATEGAIDGAVEVDTVLAVLEYWHKPLSADDPPVTFEEMIPDKRFRLAFGMTDVVTSMSINSAQFIHSIELTLAGSPPEEVKEPEKQADEPEVQEKDKTEKPEKTEKKDEKKLIGVEKGQKGGRDDTNSKSSAAKSDKKGTGDGKGEDEGKGTEAAEPDRGAETSETPPVAAATGYKLTLIEVDDNAGGEELKKDGYQPWRVNDMSAEAAPYIPGGGSGMSGPVAGTLGGLLLLGGLWRFLIIKL
jgi:hypothetical protein